MEGANSNFIDEQNKKPPLRQPTVATQERLLNSVNQVNVNDRPNGGEQIKKQALRRPTVATQERLFNSLNMFDLELNRNNNATCSTDEEFENKPRPFTFNVNAIEFVPRITRPVFADLVQEFQKTLFILTTNPGNMEEYMRPMCDMFSGVNAAKYMQDVIELLYEQSIAEPNFRYTGARVCQHICSVLKDHSIFSDFRNQFLKRCQQDFNKRDHLLSNPPTIDRACGLTLFMGELFQNLEIIGNDGKPQKIGFLPEALRDLLLSLLSYPSDTSVKCACQLLKLCGASMEDMLRSEDFDQVFTSLQGIAASPHLRDNTKFLIQTVVKLRESDWGRKGSSTLSSQNADFNHYSYQHSDLASSEPIFYNESGQTISREQAGFAFDEPEESYDDEQYVLNEEEDLEFLQWQQETLNGSAGEPDFTHWSNPAENNFTEPNYPYADNGMDDEMDADFEEFLRQQQHPQ
ncbi:polyadenylate-binding protein-interacting protein 1-like isoform X3 [Gigantopelta aegis]|uniref:polyadenylate-binding protein-interacting protein 1-like isoform X3 n=1 Tax=Gigantopelta aegis TaxID=1735272 RepID=UPI001B88C1F9|nr:polyadenylate-binding protein-interacting protein 1-like isoform X3 [Gigantopelta aegis]